MKTGKLTIFDNAMAREIITDNDGKATAGSYIDKRARAERRIYGRIIVVAASTCESARLLLNSQSSRFPRGLANDSGVVGRFLMDTVGFSLWGYVPALEGMKTYDTDGWGSPCLYALVGARQEK